jgi:uncharacterized protein involved in outer membrane biogenesis
LVVAVFLAIVAVATVGPDVAKPWISRQASQIANRPVVIDGDLAIDWLRPGEEGKGLLGWVPWPKLTAKDIRVGNPEQTEAAGNMAEVESLTVVLNPAALLDRVIQIPSLQIENAKVALQRNAEGVNNWTFGDPADKDKKPSKWKLDLQKVQLDRVNIQVSDAASHLDLKADVNSLKEPSEKGYGIGWEAAGTYNKAEISGKGQAGDVLSLRSGADPFPLQGEVNVGETTIAIEGSVTRPQALASLEVQLKLAGDSMADLNAFAGVALPNTPPYNTSGHLVGMLEGDSDTWRYENFEGQVGESDVQGTVQFQIREPRPLLTGNIESKLLRFSDLGPLIGVDTSEVKGGKKEKGDPKQPPGKALPVGPIGTEAWARMDADVMFKGRKILRGKNLPLDDIDAHIKLNDRVLSLTPLNFGVAGGTLRNTITLDGRQDKIQAKMVTAARNLKLKQLFPAAKSMDASFGELHGDAKLTGQGRSIAELLGTADGQLSALVTRGTVSQFLLEAAGLNVANILLVKIFGDEQVLLDCVAADFSVKNGLMTIQVFKLETEDTTVDITGQINLRTEAIALDVVPANRTLRIFTLRSPLYAKGTFKDPEVGVQPAPLAARAGAAVALGIVATPLAALLPLLNVGTNEATGCEPLLEANGKKKQDKKP